MWQPYLSRGLRWVYLKSKLSHLSPDCGPKPDSTLDCGALVVYDRLQYYRWLKAQVCFGPKIYRACCNGGSYRRPAYSCHGAALVVIRLFCPRGCLFGVIIVITSIGFIGVW